MIHLPFFLLHRTAFTRAFILYVVSLAEEGLPIQAIARHIETVREGHAAEMVLKIVKYHKECTSKDLTDAKILSLATSPPIMSISKPVPSNDIVARCFIINFQENEMIYRTHMANQKVTTCIRLDHTFKI